VGRELAVWYVMINDEQTGPLTRVELGVELASGTISGESLVWKGGMVGWVPGAKVPELAALFTNPPKSPRAPQKPPPPPVQEKKGMGLGEFDTAHFRLADLAAEEGSAASRQMEFDTAHFKLADLGAEDAGPNRNLEYEAPRAAVPKRIMPKGAEAAAEEAAPPRPVSKAPAPRPASARPPLPSSKPPPPVANLPKAARTLRAQANPPAPKPAPSASESLELAIEVPKKLVAAPRAAPAKPAVQPDFDPSKTSVDFMAYGAQIQQAAHDLFVEAPAPAPAAAPAAPARDSTGDAIAKAKAKALSKWAADEMTQDESSNPRAPVKPPPPVHIPSTGVPIWVMVGGGVAIALVVVLFLLLRD